MMRRTSRSLQKTGRQYEQTQSVERAKEAAGPEHGPVFYLDPLDWIRTEGTVPLPLKEKSPSKLLENFTQERTNLDVFTESEENLNSEIEAINSNIAIHNQQRPLGEQRNSSLPK